MGLNVASRVENATKFTENNIGTPNSANSAYVAVNEYGDGIAHRTELVLANLPVTCGNTTAISFGSKLLYTFPQGRIFVKGVLAYFSQIAFNNPTGGAGVGGNAIVVDGSGDYSLGSTATADATLSLTDIDLLPSSAMLDPFVAGIGRSNAGSALAAAAAFDGTTTAKAVYLNAIIDDADVTDTATANMLYFTGSVQLTWEWHGDF